MSTTPNTPSSPKVTVGEHGERRQSPGYSLEDVSKVLCVFRHGGTACGSAAHSPTRGSSTTVSWSSLDRLMTL